MYKRFKKRGDQRMERSCATTDLFINPVLDKSNKEVIRGTISDIYRQL